MVGNEPSASASLIVDALLLEPSVFEQQWPLLRQGLNLDELDGRGLALVPLLAGRLQRTPGPEPQHSILLGLCKRGWARREMRLSVLEKVWALLRAGGVQPEAGCGDAALALLFAEESAVRSIESLEVLVKRQHGAKALRVLQSAGWVLEPGMPEPIGKELDRFRGIWLSGDSETALLLSWRLATVQPYAALGHEGSLTTDPMQLRGAHLAVLAPEELLYSVLLRREENSLPWHVDARVLLRNRQIDMRRVAQLVAHDDMATARFTLLHPEVEKSLPSRARTRPAGTRRMRRLWRDYREVSWERNSAPSAKAFARYLTYRLLQGTGSTTEPTIIDSTRSSSTPLREYSRHWSLFYFLTMRDIRLRYRKTWRGVVWALIQPLLPMVIFALLFARVMRPELHDGPYWLVVLTGMAPWSFVSNGANYASATFTGNFDLLNKVYFPRMILPAAAVSAFLVDLVVCTFVVLLLAFLTGHSATWHLLLVPMPLLWCAALAGSVGLAAASFNVLNREFKALTPFLLQVWMYATPILYPLALVPSRWRWLVWLNPMTGAVEILRAAVFGHSPNWPGVALSGISSLGIALLALVFFQRLEADLAERL